MIRTLILALLLFPAICLADSPQGAESSGEKTSTATIYSTNALLTGVMVYTNSSDAATFTLYDNTLAAGKILFGPVTVAGSSNSLVKSWAFPLEARTGLHGVVSGAGASFAVEYIKK